ncbi:hypothetical protein PFTANZ_02197 [Plasmodium falciparum Tanzania (2000708)]|uniref:Uncharacterized protein n=1 Tax=Plasmodium falciparum Tanzania (2000708) TaxID=1036725 RepID=A0A024W849_PLAFA|nr:hypothetical protein PFTANZ_02197 [Plasmodium falciparum Tanzania (2000708)]
MNNYLYTIIKIKKTIYKKNNIIHIKIFSVVISKSFSNAFLSMYDIIKYVLKKDNIIDYTHMIKNNGSVPLAYLYTYYIG